MDVLELTAALVAIDSQNPGPLEPEVTAFVADWARERGLRVETVEAVPGRPNLLVSLEAGGPGHLALNGHLDTKPVGDALHEWRTPPLELVVDGDTAYGLGTTDMKGAVAAMMVAMERLAAAPPPGLGTVSLLLTADEEQGSDSGAKALVEQGLLPPLDAVVIGEPSGVSEPWEGIHLVSRGICCFEVDLRTTQGHSGLSPLLGRNASLLAADVLRAFEDFRPSVRTPGAVPCSPTVNPGIFLRGGVSWGVWPGLATVGVEVRLVPGMTQEDLHSEVEALVHAVAGEAATVRYVSSAQGWIPAAELSPASRVARAAARATREVLGREVPFTAFPGTTDAASFLGVAGIDTITSLGPGWISVAHGANEKVGVSQLHQAVDIYTSLVHHYVQEPA